MCRVFKKNGICGSELEDQGQLRMLLTEEYSQPDILLTEYETLTSTSGTVIPLAPTEEDKDDSWMQFIKDDAWCSFNNPIPGQENTSQLTQTI